MLRAEPVPFDSADSNELVHRQLASANARRLAPRRSVGDFDAELEHDATMRRSERTFVEAERAAVKSEARAVPTDPAAFAAWFDALTEAPSVVFQALLSDLASEATAEQAEWFLSHDRAHDQGLEDLLALTQVNMPACSKLELARNYWAEISHADTPRLFPRPQVAAPGAPPPRPLWQALAVDNLMVALATSRHYAYQSLGALGVVEAAALRRAQGIESALQRLGTFRFERAARPAFGQRHAALWSREVLAPLVATDPSLASLIAEGALMRVQLAERRDARYLQLLRQSAVQVAHFEYAEDSGAELRTPVVPAAAPAVRPVRWRDVSARPPY
jgi:hypothetical protein